MKLPALLSSAILMVCLPHWSSAARPFATEDAGTAGMGATELEAALDFTHESACSGLALTRGLTPWLDVAAAFCYAHDLGSYDGMEAGFKLALWPERVALSGGAALGDVQRNLTLALSQRLGPVLADFSVGSALDLGSAPHPEWGLALGTELGEGVVGVELRGVRDGAASWLAGVNLPMGNLALDLGVGGSFHRGRDLNLALGLTMPLTQE